jgi:hypothetical protein
VEIQTAMGRASRFHLAICSPFARHYSPLLAIFLPFNHFLAIFSP